MGATSILSRPQAPAPSRPGWCCELPVSTQALALFTRQLAMMYHAGVSMTRSIEVLAHQSEDPRLSFALLGVLWGLENGRSLSGAMAAYPRAFPPLYRAFVGQGEAAGCLEVCLSRAAELTEENDRLSRRVRAALAYPALVAVVSCATGALCLRLMAPFLAGLGNGRMPRSTRLLLDCASALHDDRAVLTLLVLTAAGFWLALRHGKTPAARLWRDRQVLRLPLLGRVVRELALCRIARTLGQCLDSGLRLTRTLELCSQVAGNEVLRKDLLLAGRRLVAGVPLERHFASRSRLYTPAFAGMMAAGQESGSLAELAGSVAELLEVSAASRLESAVTVIQPALLGLLGIIVGLVALAAMQPIYHLL